ncbi:MAG TPA: HypC/HybG/HupF family hydrogenase formation chaperone [Bacteroidales bacterium]|nr:HypC/HybG/HupF family hydrogenase formation chaperone [Bacteroidales bacterium]
MCLGVPAKVISIEQDLATVRLGGVDYKASLKLLQDVRVGDYILLHAGFAIEKVDPAEAEETLKLIRELVGGSET